MTKNIGDEKFIIQDRTGTSNFRSVVGLQKGKGSDYETIQNKFQMVQALFLNSRQK
jgi:hypothetical protein